MAPHPEQDRARNADPNVSKEEQALIEKLTIPLPKKGKSFEDLDTNRDIRLSLEEMRDPYVSPKRIAEAIDLALNTNASRQLRGDEQVKQDTFATVWKVAAVLSQLDPERSSQILLEIDPWNRSLLLSKLGRVIDRAVFEQVEATVGGLLVGRAIRRAEELQSDPQSGGANPQDGRPAVEPKNYATAMQLIEKIARQHGPNSDGNDRMWREQTIVEDRWNQASHLVALWDQVRGLETREELFDRMMGAARAAGTDHDVYGYLARAAGTYQRHNSPESAYALLNNFVIPVAGTPDREAFDRANSAVKEMDGFSIPTDTDVPTVSTIRMLKFILNSELSKALPANPDERAHFLTKLFRDLNIK